MLVTGVLQPLQRRGRGRPTPPHGQNPHVVSGRPPPPILASVLEKAGVCRRQVPETFNIRTDIRRLSDSTQNVLPAFPRGRRLLKGEYRKLQ